MVATVAACGVETEADELHTAEQSIVDGSVEPNAGFPWVVRVADSFIGSCHGTLVTPRWVLTAAHCVETSLAADVTYTRTDPVTGLVTGGTKTVPLAGIFVHPDWDNANFSNDIALLRLPEPFAPDPLLQTADLPIRHTTTSDPLVLASGAPAPGQFNVLRGTGSLNGRTLFVDGGVARACMGDSGGGVVHRAGGVNYVAGVVSAAATGRGNCELPDVPFEAAYVPAYLEWAGQVMQAAGPVYHAGFEPAALQQYPSEYDFGLPSPYETHVGDFDGDARKDYARVGATGAYVYYGNADGTFAHVPQGFPGLDFGMPSAWTTRVGDFNGDGRDDLIRLGGPGAWLFWGSTARTFSSNFRAYSGLDFGQPTTWDTAVGDFNGDGRDDYARIGATGAWNYFGNTNKTFTQTFHEYPGLNFGQPSSWQLGVGDWNGDGRTDYARIGNTGAWIYRGNTNKTFTQSFHAYGGWDFGWPSPYELIVGDFNGDGRGDYRRLSGTGAYTFLGTSTGFALSFQSFGGPDFGTPSAWTTLVGDFNADNRDDFVRLGDTGAYVYYGTSTAAITASFWDLERHFGLPSPFASIAADFTGDGKDDVARLGGIHAALYVRD